MTPSRPDTMAIDGSKASGVANRARAAERAPRAGCLEGSPASGRLPPRAPSPSLGQRVRMTTEGARFRPTSRAVGVGGPVRDVVFSGSSGIVSACRGCRGSCSGAWSARGRDDRRLERGPEAVMAGVAALRGALRACSRVADRRLGGGIRGRRSRRVFGLWRDGGLRPRVSRSQLRRLGPRHGAWRRNPLGRPTKGRSRRPPACRCGVIRRGRAFETVA